MVVAVKKASNQRKRNKHIIQQVTVEGGRNQVNLEADNCHRQERTVASRTVVARINSADKRRKICKEARDHRMRVIHRLRGKSRQTKEKPTQRKHPQGKFSWLARSNNEIGQRVM